MRLLTAALVSKHSFAAPTAGAVHHIPEVPRQTDNPRKAFPGACIVQTTHHLPLQFRCHRHRLPLPSTDGVTSTFVTSNVTVDACRIAHDPCTDWLVVLCRLLNLLPSCMSYDPNTLFSPAHKFAQADMSLINT
eukprot:GHUV01049619.1.p1 GENE.GHUV01049619.1~~GHUV01049619.1.p1  ORF type:complete len:134 (+),score=0.86 GHUV01049619.1:87-488(+)